jgi:hypothetical protein
MCGSRFGQGVPFSRRRKGFAIRRGWGRFFVRRREKTQRMRAGTNDSGRIRIHEDGRQGRESSVSLGDVVRTNGQQEHENERVKMTGTRLFLNGPGLATTIYVPLPFRCPVEVEHISFHMSEICSHTKRLSSYTIPRVT